VIEQWLLDLLVCPQCRGEMKHETEPEESLVCPRCRLRYAVRQNIPILLIDEATPLPA
jgi:uncharacterized protein YbaR (Trm112 family)